MVERDIYEVANQLGGYIDEATPAPLASFLRRESREAAKLAARIAELEAENERLSARNLEHEMRLEAEEAKSEYWRAEALSRTGAVTEAMANAAIERSKGKDLNTLTNTQAMMKIIDAALKTAMGAGR